ASGSVREPPVSGVSAEIGGGVKGTGKQDSIQDCWRKPESGLRLCNQSSGDPLRLCFPALFCRHPTRSGLFFLQPKVAAVGVICSDPALKINLPIGGRCTF